MRTVWRYIRPYLRRISLQMLIKISGTVIELFLPAMLSVIIDEYARKPGGERGVWLMGGAMVLAALLAWLGNCIANRMSTSITREITRTLRRDLFSRITALSAAQQDRLTDASLISRLTSDTYNVHNMIDRMQRLGVRAPMLLVGGIIVSLVMEPVLTLVLIATLPLLAGTVIWSSKKGVPLFTWVQEGQDLLVRKVQENMTGARVIRALSRTRYEQEDFAAVNSDLAARQRKADLTMARVSPLTGFILNASLALVVLVGAYRVQAGVIGPGKIISFLSFVTIILNALLMVTRIFVMYSKGSASAKRIEQVLLTQPELLPAEAAGREEPYHIAFEHVTFSYNKGHNNVEDLDFALLPGQTLGVIGPTGSGKSTLLSLLMRQYDADSGQIRIDGRDIRSLSPEELHSRLGVVFQYDFLMADTIRENIRFGRALSEKAILEAVECAQAGFIHEKEGGLEAELNVRGHNLSGGQQQRVLICRALAGDPRILLLDDCSSALDFRTDRELRHALRERHGQATTVIVAQRVSSVMAADLILVMDKGRIIGKGTHGQLLTTCPMYRELCQLQLGGEAA
ncbi:MAG: ABC transporter ATP-binding protein [Clostridiales bacterium]|nr:ABC transporter ATP-binding protein [Clostridiales bacterium]